MNSIRMLFCRLTEEEWRERAQLLSEEHVRVAGLEHMHKLEESLYRQRYKAARANIEQLADALRNREEQRAVDCEERRNDGELVMELVRLDTNEVVERRPMTADERQAQLPGVVA